MTRAVLYARLSRDRSGEQTATARQLEDCRAFAASKGWEIAGEFTDADVSAYKKNVPRPGYEAMLAALDAGEVDVIVAWKLDRLLRRVMDFEKLWERCEARAANVTTVRDGIDTSAPMVGELLPRLMATFAQLESKNLSVRERRKHEETARRGRRSGGGHRPFGLTRDWSELVETEAAAIREAVPRLIAGESLYGIAADWNRRGIQTPTGKAWTVQHLRSLIASPRLAGARQVGDELVVTGAIPAILTVDQWRALQDATRRRRPGVIAGKALLVGLIRCGVCDSGLVTRRRHVDRQRHYACEKVAGKDRCGSVSVVAEPVEELVRDMVLEALDSPEMAAALAAQGEEAADVETAATVRADEAALEQLVADHYQARIIPRPLFLTTRDELEERIASGRRALERSARNGSAIGLVGAGRIRERWEAADAEWRRAVLATVVETVTIAPKGRNNAGRFDPDRVKVAWRY
jgi:site-specific DNA recombinase